MTVGGNSMGGLTVGFESMISTVLPGSCVDLNAYTSVRSSRVSSPGNLRWSALKWFDMVTPLMVIARIGGVDLVGVRPGDSVRAALAGLVQGQNLVRVALHHQHRQLDLGQVGAEVGSSRCRCRPPRRWPTR